jgi:acyl dehydratase
VEPAPQVSLEEIHRELTRQLGTRYTPEELRRFWGGDRYPGPFRVFNSHASLDTVTHFVDAIGDVNPLHRDPRYAALTRHGRVVAPPTFLLSVACGMMSASVRKGLMGFHASFDFQWERPILEGDAIHWSAVYPSELKLRASRMGGRSLAVYAEIEYVDGAGETLARLRECAITMEAAVAAARAARDGPVELHRYTEAEIRAIHDAQDAEVIRGAEPRYWEDVEPGESLTPVVHGPYNLGEAIAWLSGCGNPIARSDRIFRRIDQYDRVFTDPRTNAPVSLELVHMDPEIARSVGVPAAYDFGVQRVAWLGMLLDNWMGDDGWLRRLSVELRGFNMTGDTTWCRGEVTRKYVEGGRHCVDVDCRGENQRGITTMPARATVVLPARSSG